MQEKLLKRKALARINDARLPPAFQDASFENYIADTDRSKRVVSALNTYTANFAVQRALRPGFIFTGLPGTGKTHLACAMLKAVGIAGFSPLYASLPRLTREMRSMYGKSGALDGLLKHITTADLLVLDEIDLHGSSDHDYNTLYDIINSRYEAAGMPTIVISNRGVDQLKTDLDERIVSRILAGTKPIVFDWVGKRDIKTFPELNGQRGRA
jgi:DNA replication protein DnaC